MPLANNFSFAITTIRNIFPEIFQPGLIMQYISPLSFLPAGTSASLTARELKLAKNKMLAEFELTDSSSIQIGGKEMTRNDVLKMFDQLGQAGDLEYHAIVASDPVLLYFLQNQEMKPGEKFSIPDEQLTPEFIEWISPYFSWAFKKATLRIFRDIKPEEFETLVTNPAFMTEKDQWDAWSGVENYLQIMYTGLQDINKSKYQSQTQVIKYAGYNFVWLLCNLPEERFSFIINRYAFEIMQLAIKEFNNKKRDSAFELMGYARSLRVSEELMKDLLNKEEEMQNILKKNNKTENNNNFWWVVRLILLIAYALSRVASCDSTSHF